MLPTVQRRRRGGRTGLAVRTGACVLLAALIAGCGSGGDEPTESANGLITVKVGVLPIASLAPLYLGMERGFFEEEGLRIEPRQAQGGAAIVPAVVSNEYQFGFSNTLSMMIAREQGLGVKIIAPSNQAAGRESEAVSWLVAAPGSGIDSVDDLRGKTVAVNTLKNLDAMSVKHTLAEAGLEISDVDLREVPFPEMNGLLLDGTVDAAKQVEPFFGEIAAEGGEVIAHPYLEIEPEVTIAVYFTSDQLIADDPELVESFRRAITRSLQFARENPEAVREILPTYTAVDEKTAADMVLPMFGTELNGLDKTGRIAVGLGTLDQPPNLDEVVYAGAGSD